MNTEPATLGIERVLAPGQLPALPRTAVRLLKISQDAESRPDEFAAPIEADLGLTGQVLQFVNSSYFGFSREAASVKHAVALVGARTIKNFVLWNAVFSQMPDPRCGAFRLKQLWEDSLRRALFARALSTLIGSNRADDAFTAALLQDMAIPLLVTGSPATYARLLEARDGGRLRLSALEHETFGWTHAEAAQRMAQRWSLPEQLAAAVGSHLQIDRWLSAGEPRPTELAVAMSALLPSGADPLWRECGAMEDCYLRVFPAGGPPLATLLGRIDAEYRELAPVFNAGSSGISLVGSYEQATSSQDATPHSGKCQERAGVLLGRL